MLEKEIEAKLGREIKKLGGLYYKFTSPNMPGVPDRIVIIGGRVIFLELKATWGRLANIQKWVIAEMQKRGADVRVIRGWAEAEMLINDLKNTKKGEISSKKD